MEGPIFSQAEADKVLDAMILDELQEDFLTWMTPELRQKLYTLKLDPAEKNFFEALRKEFGVDCEANLK